MENKYDHYKLGCFNDTQSTSFRLLFPGAKAVECLIFKNYEHKSAEIYSMRSEDQEVWRLTIDKDLRGYWYQYKVEYEKNKKPDTPYAELPFADPYSRHVTVKNHYRQEAKSFIFHDSYDWEGDTFIPIKDPRDLIIYESHIKDLVVHPSSESAGKGIYKKWLDTDQNGGIPHLKKLGVNALELLPLHKFPPCEPPFGKKTKEGYHNSWNTYSRNYWGYMTSFFFAPESVYASDGSDVPEKISGGTTAAVTEFKDVVKELHRNKIAVIMDVVFNHTSLFDINPLCHHMPDIFLRRDEKGKLMNRSGTGNEINTEHPIVRKLICDSIAYWMEEFHIDGFRFDLAGLIDGKTWDLIRETAMEINPNVVLIAEPWGGRYVPYLFSNHNWSSWNDRFRNGIKGSDPVHDRGFIFSDWHNGADREQLENWFQGTIRELKGGLFKTSEHAVNYLESHDGYTLGDFIRIAARYEGENPEVEQRDKHVKLSDSELKIAKLGAFCLMVSPGIAMIHAGQEFARSKIIVDETGIDDPETGRMDYNSYNKDNQTNWIDFNDIDANQALYRYYRGLIQIRKSSPALRKTHFHKIEFDHYSDPLHVCFYVDGSESGDIFDYYIAINATKYHTMEFEVPGGNWEVLVNNGFASASPISFLSGGYQLDPKNSILLRKLRH